VNGLLIVDKPAGMTSHDVVARVRRLIDEQSIGHLGTLDPMATGVLPLLLGRFTRLAQFFGRMEKSYTGTIRFGQATDTYDAEGEPIGPRAVVSLDADTLERGLACFRGEILQRPPAYSAKKVRGRPAHELARAGRAVELKPVPVLVRQFQVTAIDGEEAAFRVTVSAGGYIRSLAHDLGERLGCGAHLASLRRVAAGPFTEAMALGLDEIGALAAAGALDARLPHPRTLLPELPATTADEATAGRLRNGVMCNLPDFSEAKRVKVFANRRDMVAIAERVAGTLFRPVVVLG
jgi:tRNA pseudouridine55 synthase